MEVYVEAQVGLASMRGSNFAVHSALLPWLLFADRQPAKAVSLPSRHVYEMCLGDLL